MGEAGPGARRVRPGNRAYELTRGEGGELVAVVFAEGMETEPLLGGPFDVGHTGGAVQALALAILRDALAVEEAAQEFREEFAESKLAAIQLHEPDERRVMSREEVLGFFDRWMQRGWAKIEAR